MIGDIKRLLLLPHIKVHNANALSSPFTIGFPAMTAWLGTAHALQRKINENNVMNISFNSVAVISHDVDLQTHKDYGDFVNSIIITSNPLDKDDKRPSFIEEARCHLDVSLLIEYTGVSQDDAELLINQVAHHLHASIKIAGGDIIAFQQPLLYKLEEGNDADLHKLIRRLMPGYAIIERRKLIKEAMEQGQDAMNALLDYLAVHHRCEQDEDGNIIWTSERKTAGWIVPIAIGFHGISELGQAKNQRDQNSPHRFAESVVTLGEFRMPHRIKSIDEILWHYHVDLEKNLYLCEQKNQLN